MRTRYLAIICIFIIMLTSIHCDRGEDRAHPDASTVTVLYDADERLLGPAHGMSPEDLVFLSLLLGPHQNGEVERRLAERWEHSPDYRTWTFYLRRDVRWHDGVPVTAHDIKFTLELLAHPAVLSFDNNLWLDMESVSVLDEFTFTITYTRPHGALDEDFIVYPKHLLEDLDPKEFYRWDFWTHPIGNGPFRYVRHVPKTMMELEANPDFYRGKPKIERVVFKFGGVASLTELLSGNVDVVQDFNPADIPKLLADGRFRVYQVSHGYFLYPIYWNHRHPLFRDPMVRRALTLAINRRELVQVQNFPENTPIFDGIMPNWYRLMPRKLPEPLPYDPELAKQLLEEAGWHDQDGDGIRERAGEAAKFTAMAQEEYMLQPAIYVQSQLRRVGIQMEVRPLASDSLRARLRAGEFEAVFFYFENSPRPILRDKWFSPGSPIGYTNPRIVKLLQAAVITFDFEAKDQIYRELMTIFCEELPMTFLYPIVVTNVAHRRLRGLENFRRTDPVADMEHLWIKEEK
jgi:peptide/nickel transport system substrate-binding protein